MRKYILVLFLLLSACAAPPVTYNAQSVSKEAVPSLQEPASVQPETPEAPETGRAKPPAVITLQFAGDILLHTNPVKNAKTGENTYDFKPYFEAVKPHITGDLVLCNMESPVDAYGGNAKLSSYPRFNVPYEILEGLSYAGFDIVLTANNHAFDKGLSGLENTLDNIEKAGLTAEGTYKTQEEFNIPKIVDVKGIKVGIIAYTDSCNGLEAAVPAQKLPYLMRTFRSGSLEDVPRMAEDIKALRGAGAELVVVALHWGAEYKDTPSASQREIAKALCEAGADVIMGGHSHCVQPIEWVEASRGGGTKKCLVMYSLGNFFADQLKMETPILKTQYGMLVSLTVAKDGGVTLENCEVLPTLSYRERYKTDDFHYKLLPLMAKGDVSLFGEDSVRHDDIAKWSADAYEHVSGIIGKEFLVFPEL